MVKRRSKKRRSGAWKSLERLTAEKLRGTRVLRGGDFSKPDVDVVVEDFPMLKLDCKYRQRWSHHSFVEEVIQKYCTEDSDIPILVTKHPHMQGAIVSLPLDAFGIFLDVLRELREEAEEE